MSRTNRRKCAQRAEPGLEALDHAELVAMARNANLKGVPEGWSKETLIKKLKERN